VSNSRLHEMPFNEAHIFVALGKLAFKIKVCNKTSAAYFCVTAVFPTYAVQAAVLRGSENFLSAEGMLRSFCGRSRKVYVLIAFDAVPSRS